jgi:hypothetical protein
MEKLNKPSPSLIPELGKCVHKVAEIRKRRAQLETMIEAQYGLRKSITNSLIDKAVTELARDLRELDDEFKSLAEHALDQQRVFDPVLYKALAFLEESIADRIISVYDIASTIGLDNQPEFSSSISRFDFKCAIHLGDPSWGVTTPEELAAAIKSPSPSAASSSRYSMHR